MAPSPTSASRMPNADTGQPNEAAAALAWALSAENVSEKERRISEFIEQLQAFREQLLMQQDPAKVSTYLHYNLITLKYKNFNARICW